MCPPPPTGTVTKKASQSCTQRWHEHNTHATQPPVAEMTEATNVQPHNSPSSAHCFILASNAQVLLGMAPALQRAALGRLFLALLLSYGLHHTCGASLPAFVNGSDPIQLAAYAAAAKEAADSRVERPLGCKCLPVWETVPTPTGKRSGLHPVRCGLRRRRGSTNASLEPA